MGIPAYGRGFALTDIDFHDFYAKASGPNPPGPYTGDAGFWGYYEICLMKKIFRIVRVRAGIMHCFH